MSDNVNSSAEFDDEMAEYLQTFLDETEEQLDDLVETMLSLESASTNTEDLNEAFRLIHSIKGSAGMMGLDNITVLTHHLENRFERFRSGTEKLDEPTMTVVLHCIDYLRQCNDRLRKGESLGSATELLGELKQLEDRAAKSIAKQDAGPSRTEPDEASDQPAVEPVVDATASADEPIVDRESSPAAAQIDDSPIRMVVRLRPGLPLADLKAQLIVNRLAGLGDLKSTLPALDSLPEDQQLEALEIRIETDQDLDRLRAAADVDGVESIDFPGLPAEPPPTVEVPQPAEPTSPDAGPEDHPEQEGDQAGEAAETLPEAETESPEPEPAVAEPTSIDQDTFESSQAPGTPADPRAPVPADTPALDDTPALGDTPALDDTSVAEKGTAKVAEKGTAKVAATMRVDIDRLDNLMNLAGELVVNRARFVQISESISAAQRKTSTLNQIREFCDNLRHTVDGLEDEAAGQDDRAAIVQQLRGGLELLDEHSKAWESDRRQLDRFGEAVDQLSRVSHSLQKGVLDTRMVPVGPLFNRFKRVIRDLAKERGKRVNLKIRGEKTELDKRMIDELGDPLMHLVRNSVDHGLESTDVRLAGGKPEVGTITLEANHSGNSVYIHIRDDGGGIDIDKIRAKLVSNRILSESAAGELSDKQALDYIWHPGFSTAKEVTDVSGRGVGMDVVLNRIRQLNGSIDVESVRQQGTHFAIRLPLTLAIINCLLVRLRGMVFSMPIDDVREIVSVNREDVIAVHGKQTFDARGEFIPLVSIDDIFHWHDIDYGHRRPDTTASDDGGQSSEVVIVKAAGKTMGLRVDELLGSQDMVIKSLSDNFVHIRGLSGASILGDGSVCLMLDVGTVFQMVTQRSLSAKSEELTT